MTEDADLLMLEAMVASADDMFTLIPPDAPGAVFAGALFSAGPAGGQTRFSAGAADIQEQAARRRCLGEMAETLAQFAEPDALGATDYPKGLTPLEAQQLTLLAGKVAVSWLPAWRLGGGAASLPAPLCLRTPSTGGSSLGCAAGETRELAIAGALFELIERDAVAMWWHGGTLPAPVPPVLLEQAGIPWLVANLRQGRTGRNLRFLDITQDFGLPVAAAVSCDADGGRLALGFGASATVGKACKSALLEMIQMEMGNRIVEMKAARNDVDALSGPDRALHDRLAALHISMLPFDAYAGAERPVVFSEKENPKMADVVSSLTRSGIVVYGIDLAKVPDAIPVVKLIAPQLQPLPMQWRTSRLEECTKRNAARLESFPFVSIL